jgi:TDG/mug DNA glycosylase family protein
MLEDVLESNLLLVFCGTAAGKRSADLRQYYADPANKFWSVLAVVGLTPRVLLPYEYRDLLKYGIGLTDIIKDQSGCDCEIDFSGNDRSTLHEKLLRYSPKLLCFNGKRAAKIFFKHRDICYGLQQDTVGCTKLFVAPSTSGAANRWWDQSLWAELTELAGQKEPADTLR